MSEESRVKLETMQQQGSSNQLNSSPLLDRGNPSGRFPGYLAVVTIVLENILGEVVKGGKDEKEIKS
jgi:hypothetical protein